MVALNMYEVRRCVAWIWRRGLGLSKEKQVACEVTVKLNITAILFHP